MQKTDSPAYEVEFKGVSKIFGDFYANKGISFGVEKGTLHALIGENGAGKSTLMKTLFGLYNPDEGEIYLKGKRSSIRSPIQAMAHGIGMVHQHFMLAGPLTALDNVILGFEPGPRLFKIDRARAKKDLNQIAIDNGLKFEKWDAPVNSLSVGEQQKLEILKLLYRNSDFLILDEPTAVLTPQEVDELFENLFHLKKAGKTILLISHKLREVMQFCDNVTVIRRGEFIASRAVKDTNADELAELMVGRHVELKDLGHRAMFANADRPNFIDVKNLNLNGVSESVKNISLNVMPGEILGIAGVQGNGQSELFNYLISPAAYQGKHRGQYKIKGKDVSEAPSTYLHSMKVGIVQEDRQREGLLLDESLIENLFLGQQEDYRYRSGFLNQLVVRRDRLFQAMKKHIESFDIRPPHPSVWPSKMSGGNQQKVLLARALDHQPDVLLISQPTRGIDVGAIERIRKKILDERNQGKAVLLVSTELDELITLSDRIVVFYHGEIHGEFSRREFDEYAIGKVMGCGRADSTAQLGGSQ